MTSKLKHSKKLSKRFRKDPDFSSTLYPELKTIIALEVGIYELKHLKEEESIFSQISICDTDQDIDKYTNIEKNDTILSILKKYKANMAIISSRRLKKSKWNNKILVFKEFNLKRNPNPITEIRFLDYVFYLDSDMFLDTNYKTTKEFTGLPQTIYNHKRASSVIFDKKKQCFVINVHEKNTEDQQNFSSCTKFSYYLDWLQSMGNSKAIYLIDILVKLKQSSEDYIKKIPQYASQYS